MSEIANYAKEVAQNSKNASALLSNATLDLRNKVIKKAAEIILEKKDLIIIENQKDLEASKTMGLSSSMIDRLVLDSNRIDSICEALNNIAKQTDPVGKIIEEKNMPNGLNISKIKVPIGVVFIVFESRPNVASDSAALCIKSGNCTILRGGKEAVNSNKILVNSIREALEYCNLPKDCVQLVNTTDYVAVSELVHQVGIVDLVIPRGGERLIKAVSENSWIPVLKHYKGVCHLYIDKDADAKMALDIAVNAKTQRPGVCNAIETLLIDESFSKDSANNIISKLIELGVTIKGCELTQTLNSKVENAEDLDWDMEYLDLIISVKFVKGVQGAINHIRIHGSGHTESIITNNKENAEVFLKQIDSSSVMWNVSTRFSDGSEYGLGAEIGISTDKLHARGPMGADDLTTYKWIVRGDGHIRP